MKVVATALPGVVLIYPEVHRDPRGQFVETYHAERYRAIGIAGPFVQDNCSRSVRHTLRGLHLQVERPQAKLIRVLEGEIYDVAVDVRRHSPTFGRWVGTTLTPAGFVQWYIPAGFAHGFAVLSETAHVEYKCSDLYFPPGELGIAWNDPELAIDWPVKTPLLSVRDQRHPRLVDVASRLPEYAPPRTDL